MRHHLLPVAVLAIAVLGLASSAAHSRPDQARLHFDRVVLYADSSGSLDSREYSAVIEAVGTVLPDLLLAVEARGCACLPWAGASDAWRTALSVLLPAPTVPTGAPPRLGEAERLFRSARLLAEAKAAAAADVQAQAARTSQRCALSAALRPLLDLLEQAGRGQGTSTALSDVLARCGSEAPGTLILILSDGQPQNCPGSTPTVPRTLPDGVRVALVLVPGKMDGGDATVIRERRIATLHRTAPWLTIIPSFRVSTQNVDWLTGALECHGPEGRSGSDRVGLAGGLP